MKRGEKAIQAVTNLHQQLDEACVRHAYAKKATRNVIITLTLEDARILRQAFEEAQTTTGVLVSLPAV